jgi:hypothetical protein
LPDTPTYTYRIAFWRIYFAAVVYAQAFYTPLIWGVLYLLSPGPPKPFPFTEIATLYIFGSLLLALSLIPAFWVYVRILVVRVSADGFTCSNGFGKLRTVPWGSVTWVKALHLPGFPYLLVTTDRSRLKLWLPLFLRDMPEFAEKVEQFAGADHVLYQALWPRVEQKS